MKNSINYHDVFAKRLKEARLAKGLSQKRLGILSGLDEFVASARINRYEQKVHHPDVNTAAHLAWVLELPLAYFYCDDDGLAKVIAEYDKLG